MGVDTSLSVFVVLVKGEETEAVVGVGRAGKAESLSTADLSVVVDASDRLA